MLFQQSSPKHAFKGPIHSKVQHHGPRATAYHGGKPRIACQGWRNKQRIPTTNQSHPRHRTHTSAHSVPYPHPTPSRGVTEWFLLEKVWMAIGRGSRKTFVLVFLLCFVERLPFPREGGNEWLEKKWLAGFFFGMESDCPPSDPPLWVGKQKYDPKAMQWAG